MKPTKVVLLLASWLVVSPAQMSSAQTGTAPYPACIPATPDVPAPVQAGRGPAPQPARDVTTTAIPGVVGAGLKWTKVWQAAGNSADGLIPDAVGNILVAQEDYDAVLKIDGDGKTSVFVAGAKGIGSLSMDRQGRLYGAHRTERPGSTKPDRASIVNAITILAPQRAAVAEKWADGMPLSIRPNDLAADSHGGAYFTVGCLYYAGTSGVTVAAENLRTNGIAFNLDDTILYVTNGGGGGTPGTIVAFDVKAPGVLANRRDFAMLPMGNGDGMAVDAEGRVYVTSGPGVQVFDKAGMFLGIIPTPRGTISVAFAGPDKKTLYVVGSGAETPDGQPIREGPQLTAATIYKLPMIAQGVKGRAK